MSPLNRVFRRGCWSECACVRECASTFYATERPRRVLANRSPLLRVHASSYSRACEEQEEARLLPHCGGVEPLTYCRLAWPCEHNGRH